MADSPFILGTKIQYAWDSTSLSWLKTCPRLYEYSMIEGYRLKAEKVDLKFGIIYHSSIEAYDHARAEGESHAGAYRRAVRKALVDSYGWESDNPNKNRDTLVRSIVWYIDRFENDTVKTIILANGRPAVELSFRFSLDFEAVPGTAYMLCGHLDRLGDMDGNIFILDKKTTKSTLTSRYFEGYAPHNQMSLYTIAGQIGYQTAVKGVIIDAAQIAVGFTEFSRGVTYRTPAQSEEWLADFRYWVGIQRQFAEADYFPMNDTACDKFGGCVFREICSKDPSVRKNFLETKFERKPWNPLESR